MRTVVVGVRPPELVELIERRRALGLDTFDEMWNGEYHMAPGPSARHGRVDHDLVVALASRARRAGLVGTGPFNLGEADDYRVPDAGLHCGRPSAVYLATAAIVVEVVSPGDETFDKFDFYARHEVAEVIVADPQRRVVRIWRLSDGRYAETGRSDLLDVRAEDLGTEIDWP